MVLPRARSPFDAASPRHHCQVSIAKTRMHQCDSPSVRQASNVTSIQLLSLNLLIDKKIRFPRSGICGLGTHFSL
jgi:hypothetical protein